MSNDKQVRSQMRVRANLIRAWIKHRTELKGYDGFADLLIETGIGRDTMLRIMSGTVPTQDNRLVLCELLGLLESELFPHKFEEWGVLDNVKSYPIDLSQSEQVQDDEEISA